MTAENDNTPPRPRLVPLIGTLNVDTGVYEPAKVIELLPADLLAPVAVQRRD